MISPNSKVKVEGIGHYAPVMVVVSVAGDPPVAQCVWWDMQLHKQNIDLPVAVLTDQNQE